MKKNKCDLMIANDKMEMEQHGRHVAHLIGNGWEEMYRGKDEIAKNLVDHLKNIL